MLDQLLTQVRVQIGVSSRLPELLTCNRNSTIAMPNSGNAMAVTSLKRWGTNSFQGMLVAQGQPQWAEKTVLMRFMEREGCSTPFIISKDALKSFVSVEMWRIYDIVVPGKCVKNCNALDKYGIRSAVEVRMCYNVTVSLAANAWPTRPQYVLASWEDINQVENDKYIDLIGRVLKTPTMDQNSSISKMTLELGCKEMKQSITMLGEKTKLVPKEGDIVAFGGIRVKQWKNQRSLETTFMTLIEINPSARAGIPALHEFGTEEPTKKALRITLPAAWRAEDVTKWGEGMMQQAPTEETREFVLTGKVPLLTPTFFEADPPLVLVGNPPSEKICLKTEVEDQTGKLQIRIWDQAAYELFQVTANKLREMWEDGLQNPDKQEGIIEELNKNLHDNQKFLCEAKVWSYGAQKTKHSLQVNVTAIDDSD